VEWNVRVEQLLAQTQGKAAKEHIQREFGFIGTKDAQRHGDRLKLRVEQTEHAGSICESLIEFCSSIKELSVRVEEVQIPTATQSLVQLAGVRGPGAIVMQTSALKLAPKRPAEENEMDEAATRNNCYLCSLNGRALTECCILVPGSQPREYLNGHSRKRAHVVCKWFDEKYKEGSAERVAKIEEAGRVRKNALELFSKRKIQQTSALKSAPKRPAEENEMDEAATRNNCYLCSLNGRALTECCILVPGSQPPEYLNGHGRKRAHVVCKWFDEKYKEGSAERVAKIEEAGRVRKNALERELFSKRKKRSTN
jgi:hypothetical protein